MKTLLFLVDGFEEIEALGAIDILRRGGVEVSSVSVTGKKEVMGSHKIPVIADMLFEEADFSNVEMLVLPGGTIALNEHEPLKAKVKEFAGAGKKVAAICAAPMVLGGLGILKGKRATVYPGYEQYLDGAIIVPEPVIIEDNIITGRGPGLTFKFALTLVEILKGKEVADKVSSDLLLK